MLGKCTVDKCLLMVCFRSDLYPHNVQMLILTPSMCSERIQLFKLIKDCSRSGAGAAMIPKESSSSAAGSATILTILTSFFFGGAYGLIVWTGDFQSRRNFYATLITGEVSPITKLVLEDFMTITTLNIIILTMFPNDMSLDTPSALGYVSASLASKPRISRYN